MLYYGYLAGANYFAEEWGPENTFHDWHEFRLTPYGEAIRDFVGFMKSAPPVGEPFTPIALVYDCDRPLPLSLTDAPHDHHLLRLYPGDARLAPLLTLMRTLANTSRQDKNTEDQALVNSPYPVLWDVVPANAPAKSFRRYGATVWLHPDRPVPVALRQCGAVLSAEDPSACAAEIMRLCRSALPFWVEGDVLWAVNRHEGSWVVGLFNNKGVSRDKALDVVLDPAATAAVRILRTRGARVLAAWPPSPEIRSAGESTDVSIQAGGFAILAITKPVGR